MSTLVVNIIIILALILLVYISFQAGIIRTVFAVLAGFVSILLAENYPYQYGINYYLVFAFSALVVFFTGLFCVRVLKFLCLSIFDKLAGAVVGLILGFVICANCLVPTLTQGVEEMENGLTNSVSKIVQKTMPIFDEYIPKFAIDKKIKNSKDYLFFGK